MKPKELSSATLGRFVPDPEPPPMPILVSKARWQGATPIDICLVALNPKPDWPALLRRAENLFPQIERSTTAWLQAKAEEILRLHREYFGDEWHGKAVDLIPHVTITNINFDDNGSVELWFDGDDVFHCLNLNVNLDDSLNVEEVRFDG